MNIELKIISKTLNYAIIIALCFCVVCMVMAYLNVKILIVDVPKPKSKLSVIDESVFAGNKELRDITYYKKLINAQIFSLPKTVLERKENLKELENLKAQEGAVQEDISLEGIVWSGNSEKSVVVLKNKKSSEIFYLKRGQIVGGWVVGAIDKFSVSLVSSSNKNIVKVLNLKN